MWKKCCWPDLVLAQRTDPFYLGPGISIPTPSHPHRRMGRLWSPRNFRPRLRTCPTEIRPHRPLTAAYFGLGCLHWSLQWMLIGLLLKEVTWSSSLGTWQGCQHSARIPHTYLSRLLTNNSFTNIPSFSHKGSNGQNSKPSLTEKSPFLAFKSFDGSSFWTNQPIW